MRKIKTEMMSRDLKFKRELMASRPHLEIEKHLSKLKQIATPLSKNLVNLTSKVLSLQTSLNYAQNMLKNDLGADDIEISFDEIMGLSIKLLRVQILLLLCQHFNVSAENTRHIVSNCIDFFFVSKKAAVAPQPRDDMVNKMMESIGAYATQDEQFTKNFKDNKIRSEGHFKPPKGK